MVYTCPGSQIYLGLNWDLNNFRGHHSMYCLVLSKLHRLYPACSRVAYYKNYNNWDLQLGGPSLSSETFYLPQFLVEKQNTVVLCPLKPRNRELSASSFHKDTTRTIDTLSPSFSNPDSYANGGFTTRPLFSLNITICFKCILLTIFYFLYKF